MPLLPLIRAFYGHGAMLRRPSRQSHINPGLWEKPMWTMMVFLVATNIQVMVQDMDGEAVCRAAAYRIVNPGITYVDCHPRPPPPVNGLHHPVIGFTITDKEH